MLMIQLNNNNVLEDTHPRLQPTDFFRNQVMVNDSTTIIEPTSNE